MAALSYILPILLSPGRFLKDPSGLGEAFQGGELFPNTFPPCFVPGERSEAGRDDMWCDEVHKCSKIDIPLPVPPVPPLAQEGMR